MSYEVVTIVVHKNYNTLQLRYDTIRNLFLTRTVAYKIFIPCAVMLSRFMYLDSKQLRMHKNLNSLKLNSNMVYSYDFIIT